MNNNDKPTENIEAKLNYSSAKAYFITYEGWKNVWIPQSIVHNQIDLSNTEDEQVFSIEYWFVKKNELY